MNRRFLVLSATAVMTFSFFGCFGNENTLTFEDITGHRIEEIEEAVYSSSIFQSAVFPFPEECLKALDVGYVYLEKGDIISILNEEEKDFDMCVSLGFSQGEEAFRKYLFVFFDGDLYANIDEDIYVSYDQEVPDFPGRIEI